MMIFPIIGEKQVIESYYCLYGSIDCDINKLEVTIKIKI